MAKARTCRRCVWRKHKVEPCCWCRRLHKGKKDDYFKEDEEVEKDYTTKELIESLRCCKFLSKCESCIFSGIERGKCCDLLFEAAAETIEQLQQELINERDRYNRLVSFELCEAKELAARKLRQREEAFLEEKRLQRGEACGGADWQAICRMNAEQEEKGVKKYGQMLEENVTLSREQRIEHAQEELIDALKYLEHLKAACRDSLTANDYQRMAMRTNDDSMSELDMLRNAVYGLNGEAGEIIDLLKKHEFQGHELDREELIEECGDVLWYCALFATALSEDLQSIMERNIAKLRDRYPEGFDKARSINREG